MKTCFFYQMSLPLPASYQNSTKMKNHCILLYSVQPGKFVYGTKTDWSSLYLYQGLLYCKSSSEILDSTPQGKGVRNQQGWAPRSLPFGTFCSFPFFKRIVPFFSVLFSSFWRLIRPKRTQRTQRSFAKNVKERKERNILLQRT